MLPFIAKSILIGLFAVHGSAFAAPEMRCRLSGAYIKVYGQDATEQREVCERQGGEFTRYESRTSQGGDNPRQKAMESIFGRRPGGAR